MLDERSRKVLNAVIQCYINSLGPVGSRLVTKKFPFGLSPATIRNIMADLEEMGFLMQPHTSAGRVPTDIGYRFYVDSLREQEGAALPDVSAEMTRMLERVKEDMNVFLDEAARMLSSLSSYVGITVSPNMDFTSLSKIELIKYRKDQLAVVLLTGEGIISHRVVPIEADVSQKDLTRMAEYINETFSGRTFAEIRTIIAKEMARERILCDNMISDAVSLCRKIFAEVRAPVYISGLSEVLRLPDFSDIEKIRDLMRTIEDKHVIMRLLDRIAGSEGTQVYIGSENPLEEMHQFSLVASTYKERERPIGVIAVIGPTRMNYPEVISLVSLTAQFITDLMSYNTKDGEPWKTTN